MNPVARLASILVVVCVLGLCVSGRAQDTSSISGTITDPSGAALPNATVLIRNDATNAEHTSTTNESGNFNLTNLPSGNYTIRVEAPSFQTTTLSNVHIDPSIGRRVDIPMKMGDTKTEVT